MNKVMSRNVILAGAVLFLGMPAVAGATGGMIGDCVDCHTMHNSEQGEPVAMVGDRLSSTAPSATPIQNLLRMDCMACHAGDPAGDKIINMGGGSAVPQVLHNDATGDLAGGNFAYLNGGASPRKGHNVIDLSTADNNGEAGLTVPPGMWHGTTTHSGAARFTMDGGFLANFTCAGSAGCHGTRNQALSADVNANIVTDTNTGITSDGPDFYENAVRRSGIPAISGAHHNSFDGAKDAGNATAAKVHDGAYVASGYRFIPGLKSYGNETNRWQNNSSTDHNEYYGNTAPIELTSCGNCHQNGSSSSTASHLYLDGYLKVPNESVSGFCVTCHGEFHSTGNGANGSSTAFLRHPSDYVLPDRGEYADYTTYNITAPVARNAVATSISDQVNAGSDLVMCMSCHMAHASQYDAMLRFNYDQQQAGNATAGLDTGCLACHTSKGILPEAR